MLAVETYRNVLISIPGNLDQQQTVLVLIHWVIQKWVQVKPYLILTKHCPRKIELSTIRPCDKADWELATT